MLQTASIPPVAMAAIVAYVGAFHLVIWLRSRGGRVNLTFALTCLCAALYDVACAGLYSAGSIQEGMPWNRLQRIALALGGTAFIWFLADYTRRVPRPTLHALSALGLGNAMVLAVWPSSVLTNAPDVKVVRALWGDTLTYYEMGVRPVGYVLEAFGILLFVAGFVAAARQHRGGELGRARPLMLALGVLGAGVANDIAVDARLLRTPYAIEYAFLGLVVLMAYSLMDEILRAEGVERAALESQARYRDLVEGTEDLVLQLDLRGRISFANRGAAQALGIPHQVLAGMSFLDTIPLGEREHYERVMKGWNSGGPSHPSLELRHESASGSPLHVLWRVTTVTDAAGGRLGFNAIGRDVTQVREAEAERRLLSAAIEQTGEVVIITDSDGTIQYVNPAFEQVTGWARAEVIGKTPAILKSGHHDIVFYRHLWSTITSGSSWRGQLTNRRKDGSLYVEEAVISPVRDDAGWLTHFVGVKRDITAEVRLEERLRQAEKLEAVGLLAGGIAHDFNNLLTPILGYADLLELQCQPGDPAEDALQAIRRAAEDSQRLTEQLLTFGRKRAIEPRVVDLAQLVAHTSEMLKRSIREDIHIDIEREGEPCLVKVDAPQMQQVLMNLAVNAQDAMPKGGRMRILTRFERITEAGRAPAGPEPGAYAVLTVIDTGVGMDPETRARVFEPFFTTKAEGRGTGLGLATAYGIVKHHGGWVVVESEPGRGARFDVYLPCALEPASRASTPSASRKSRRGTETILVVEDNDQVRKLARDILETQGYTVLTAESGAAALALAEAFVEPIHVVLTDVIMPGMSGRELSGRMTALRPGIRVLFMSGHARDVIAPEGVLEERVDLIDKPFSVETLTTKLREILDR